LGKTQGFQRQHVGINDQPVEVILLDLLAEQAKDVARRQADRAERVKAAPGTTDAIAAVNPLVPADREGVEAVTDLAAGRQKETAFLRGQGRRPLVLDQ